MPPPPLAPSSDVSPRREVQPRSSLAARECAAYAPMARFSLKCGRFKSHFWRIFWRGAMRRFPVRIAWVMVGGAIASGWTRADVMLLGAGSAGGLQPDLPQRWGQPVAGICSAAATSDMLWYIDQHSTPGIVDHVDKTKPNDTWRDKGGMEQNGDGKDLVFDMAKRIYGDKYFSSGGTD